MWIVTKIGFFSIVQKPEDVDSGMLTIRARVRKDLENLRKYIPEMGDTKRGAATDYQYRIRAPRDVVAAALSALVVDIDYRNFKNEVARVQGYERSDIYGGVWQELYELAALEGDTRGTD